jgi:PAS domain S-box-containing protein
MTERTNAHFNKIFNGLKLLVLTLDENQKISYANPFFLHLINSSFASIQGKNWSDVFVHEQNTAIKDILEKTSHEKHSAQYIDELKTQDGNILLVKWNITALENENSIYQGILCIGEDITQHMNNEASLQRQLSELAILHGITLSATTSQTMDDLVADATRLLTSVFSLNNYGIYLANGTNSLVMHDSYQGLTDKKNRDKIIPSTEGILGYVFQSGELYYSEDVQKDKKYYSFDPRTKSELAVPIRLHQATIGVINAESEEINAFTEEDKRLLTTFADTLSIAIEKINLFESTQQQAKEISLLYETAIATSSVLDSEKLFSTIYEKVKKILPLDTFVIVKTVKPNNEYVVVSAIENNKRLIEWEGIPFQIEPDSPFGWVIQKQKPLLIQDLTAEKVFSTPIHGEQPARSWLGIPLIVHEKAIGVMAVQSYKPGIFSKNDLHLVESLGSQIAITMENTRLLEQTQRQLERLSALHDIDLVINSSLDLRVTLNILLDQVVEKLNVDAAAVLLLNQQTQLLNFAAGRGFRTRTIESYKLRLGEGISGQATMERHLVQALDLFESDEGMAYLPLLQEEGFLSFYSVPLIAKGQVKGVLDIFNRKLITPDQDWIFFLETLAGQAAIAIDNTTLLENLQRSNIELSLAYDTTLEGWTRALDLRDQETEGHTQRVVEMTVRLAQLMGIADKDLIHIRRGALLHDIGKMGIPDSILLKPGPLTEEEWLIMRKHPVFAYNLLSPIAHLRQALDIPYCHHEWWNGSGYPRQLKGEEIPLSARIFSVVDVWDALTSDRPYRKAWNAKKTLDYIEEQKDIQFDPQVVELFLKLIKNELFKKL